LRIGHFTEVYKPVINGVVNSISLCKRILESMGHEIYVFTIGNEDHQDDEPNIVRSPAVPLSDTGYHLSFRFSRRAQELAGSMEVLHVHHPFLAGRQALRIAQRNNIPLVYTNHTRIDLMAQVYLSLIPDSLSSAFLEAYMPNFTGHCSLVVAPSRTTSELMRSWGVTCPIEVIPNGIDLAPFRQAESLPGASLGFPESATVAIYVGRIGGEKNLAFMLRAFRAAAADVDDLYLVLVGEGPERENLEDLANQSGLRDKVKFAGEVPYEQIPSYLAMADLFVMTSTGEVCPLNVMEALVAGLPVAAVDVPGVAELVADGVSGLLSEQTVESFAISLYRLASDRQLRVRLAGGARPGSRERARTHRPSAATLRRRPERR